MSKNGEESGLSKRELEILTFVLKGKSNRRIAEELFISLSTVKNHVHNIYKKLGVKNRLHMLNLLLETKSQESGYADSDSPQMISKKSDQEIYQLLSDLFGKRKDLYSDEIDIAAKVPSSPYRIINILKGSWKLMLILVLVILVAGITFVIVRKQPLGFLEEKKMLVVLPFENLGDSLDSYFTDGINEEIASRLAALYKVGVISRTSAFQYKDTKKTIKQIGKELGVEYVLEGTIRWSHRDSSKDHIRITLQLIQVTDDTCLWTETYNRIYGDIFSLQSEIAEQVAEHLDLAMLDAGKESLPVRLSNNIEAYDCYLRGKEYNQESWLYGDVMGFERALEMFEKAIDLDPGFTFAYLHLARTHQLVFLSGLDRSENRLKLSKEAVDQALALQPTLPEAHLYSALLFYWGYRDYDQALEILNYVNEKRPHLVYPYLGYIQRRKGDWDASLDTLEKSFQYDPRSCEIAHQIALSYIKLRKYPDARKWLNRALAIDPDYYFSQLVKVELPILESKDIQASRALLAKLPSHLFTDYQMFSMFMLERHYDDALWLLESFTYDYFISEHLYLPKDLAYAMIYHFKGDETSVKAYATSAIAKLEKALIENPEDPRIHAFLGMTYAYLGNSAEAVIKGKRAVEICPESKDALNGPYYAYLMAKIYTVIGNSREAIDLLEHLLSVPCGQHVSVPVLQLDPFWDPLRDHSRFQNILTVESKE